MVLYQAHSQIVTHADDQSSGGCPSGDREPHDSQQQEQEQDDAQRLGNEFSPQEPWEEGREISGRR
ncbi:MAG: hypothetical protein CMJ61_06625 [Planctomycetaceae bacterium]|nr:hypothetical protein [Planctomycetaceae bacterium]